MITVTIGNTTSKVEGLNLDQLRDVRLLMSYVENLRGGFRKFSSVRRHLLDKRTGVFPSGILYLLEGYIAKSNIPVKWVDTRIAPETLQDWPQLKLPYEPYPEQVEAANACITHPRGVISATTGFGKSAVIALITSKVKVPTIIIVPTLELKSQLTEFLTSVYGAKYVGSLKDRRLIAIENLASNTLKTTPKSYKCLIIDEFHHSSCATIRKLNAKVWGHIFHRYGLTATFFRSQESERLLLEGVLSNEIYTVNYQQAVDRGFITPIEAYFIEIPPKAPKGEGWHSVYSETVVNNEVRNNIIINLMLSLSKAGKSTLVLTKEVSHGYKLSCDGAFNFAHGENEETKDLIKKLNNRTINTLIGTTGVLGEGISISPPEFVIIAGLGKSKSAIMQQIGRGVRRYPSKETAKIIIFLDKSHKFTINHYKAQRKILRDEYGCEPIKLDI